MALKRLKKPALVSNADDLPIEILNPINAAKHYSLKTYAPASKLMLFVDHYWVLRWDLPTGSSFTCEVIPSPYVNLTFMKEGPQITGVTTGKYTYEVTGTGLIVGAKFKPGGYYAFARRSASDITDVAIPAQEVFETADEAINATVLDAQTDANAIALLENLLISTLPKHDDNITLVNKIIDEIKSNEHSSVRSIILKHGIAERRLQELFQRYVGVGPKWVLLRYRLLRATQLALVDHTNWSEVASTLGYSDQSHFINDFKRIVGKTPKEYSKITKS